MEEDGPLNVLYAPKDLFPRLIGREPTFEEAPDWMQFAYTADQAGYYVAPASTVFTQSAVAEGDKLFLEIISNLMRLYPEVYGPAVYLGRAPELMEFLIGKGEGMSSL